MVLEVDISSDGAECFSDVRKRYEKNKKNNYLTVIPQGRMGYEPIAGRWSHSP